MSLWQNWMGPQIEHGINTFNQGSIPLSVPEGHIISDRAKSRNCHEQLQVLITPALSLLSVGICCKTASCAQSSSHIFLFFRLTMLIHFQFVKKKDMTNNLMLITLWIISQVQNILTYWHTETKQNAMLVVVVPYRTDCDMQHSRVCVCVCDRREHTPSLQSTSFTQVIMWTSA